MLYCLAFFPLAYPPITKPNCFYFSINTNSDCFGFEHVQVRDFHSLVDTHNIFYFPIPFVFGITEKIDTLVRMMTEWKQNSHIYIFDFNDDEEYRKTKHCSCSSTTATPRSTQNSNLNNTRWKLSDPYKVRIKIPSLCNVLQVGSQMYKIYSFYSTFSKYSDIVQ